MTGILVTGANGQLGSELRNASGRYPGFDFLFTDLPEADITDPVAVSEIFKKGGFGALINCAAYTAVDKAESDVSRAMEINGNAVGFLAEACRKHDVCMVHISTDYVFNGKLNRPYREDDPVNPVSAYGRSKLAGELAFREVSPRGLIIRTSWLYSAYGSNFIKSILTKARESGQLNVVRDQTGSPTYARDLAGAILEILPAVMRPGRPQTVHYANRGSCSWFDFALAAVRLAGLACLVEPLAAEDYPAAAPRPVNSVLDTSRIMHDFKLAIPQWHDSLAECIKSLQDSGFV